MKRFSTLFKMGLLCLAVFSIIHAAGAGFQDVPGTHDNSDAVKYVQDNGIVSGYPDGTYKPDQKINRAEFTKIIIGAAFTYDPKNDPKGKEAYSSKGLKFTDIEDGAWYIPYLQVAVQNNVISGYPDGTYKPAQNINFVEAAKIIAVAFKYKIVAEEVWYKPYVSVLEEKKCIPTSVKTFETAITRGEMAEMIYRIKAGITNKASKTYAELEGKNSVMEVCKNSCGDGICQEIVCQGTGCPCVESPDTCSKDCKAPQAFFKKQTQIRVKATVTNTSASSAVK